MTDVHESQYRSIANPRRTQLVSMSAAEAAAPHADVPHLKLVGEDGPACVDGVCAIPD
ncbi:hypothetical protein L1785_04945 [Antribacter sp. KLBMP9083]|uniref:Uncharacterized protein n=1 Tax=Antribacter soli TaxID=2910976 RepID=A0AA41QCY3_9MICO|nr:hypothetical protein [Antribacter soli]MCF4120321.1 hypothetical protein [Antribacter soli]